MQISSLICNSSLGMAPVSTGNPNKIHQSQFLPAIHLWQSYIVALLSIYDNYNSQIPTLLLEY